MGYLIALLAGAAAGAATSRGYCELRKADRTFRLDRVARAVDVRSGAPVPDLLEHLLRLHEEQREAEG